MVGAHCRMRFAHRLPMKLSSKRVESDFCTLTWGDLSDGNQSGSAARYLLVRGCFGASACVAHTCGYYTRLALKDKLDAPEATSCK